MGNTNEQRPGSWTFDPTRFARTVVGHRQRLGWSTRDLARRARVSQPYVVALERARTSRTTTGPTPTVDVVARLAGALGLDPVELFSTSLRPAGRHVLMVVDRVGEHIVRDARRASGATEIPWVDIGQTAKTASATEATRRRASCHSIELRRTVDGVYHPPTVASSLTEELVALGADIEDRDIALVFSDTSNVMASVADPDTIARLEHRWADVVSRAAATARAHAAWNVCVYEIGTLRTLPDPIATTLDLMRSHDVTWSSHRSEVTSGVAGVQHVLERLRPAGTSPVDWRATARELTAGICPAA